jgi:hypothetical protein
VRQDEGARESGVVEAAAGRRRGANAQVVVAAAGLVGEEAWPLADKGCGSDGAGVGRRRGGCCRGGGRGGGRGDAAAGVFGRRAHSGLGAVLKAFLAGANEPLDQAARSHAHVKLVATSCKFKFCVNIFLGYRNGMIILLLKGRNK